MRRVALLVGCVGLAVAAGCGRGPEATIRIGVLGVCQGTFAPFYDGVVAGAELPLLERAGKRSGPKPSDGVRGAKVAGRPLELVFGCADDSGSRTLVQARRLVEQEHVQIVVGPETSAGGIALRNYARTKPGVPFLIALSPAVEPTLEHPVANVFRFTTNALQWTAGLGTYAYRTLGWRRAVVVGNDFQFPWAEAAGFVAEFCSLGGTIVQRVWGDPPRGVQRDHVDGYFLSEFLPQYLTAEAHAIGLQGDLSRRLLVGSAGIGYVAQGALGPGGRGVVGGSPTPTGSSIPSWSRFVAAMRREFPTVPPTVFAATYATSVEAALRGLEAVDGDLSHGAQRLKTALAELRFTGPTGSVRLDGHRQAIAPNYLVQAGPAGLKIVRTLAAVDDSYAGRFSPAKPLPGRTSPPCVRGNPPRWAR